MKELLAAVVHSPEALVGWSAFLATFVASVMADEQNVRLRQGTFGAIAGAGVGGLAAVMQKDGSLLLVGIFGSACGAIVGWIVYLLLSGVATQAWAQGLIDYHVSGLKGVRARLDEVKLQRLLVALGVWSQTYRGMVLRELPMILAKPLPQDYALWAPVTLRGWLTSLVDALNLSLDALEEKRAFHPRVTIILFGQENGKMVGRHWISYAGDRQGHKDMPFDETSVAYKVLSGENNSPCFTSVESANREAQNRGDKSYSSFYIFRLNDCSVLSLDWLGKVAEEDPYISVARRLLHQDVGPTIGKVLDNWPILLADAVKAKNRGAPAAALPLAGPPPPGP